MDTGLYQENITILTGKGDAQYTGSTSGCFMNLNVGQENTKSLAYVCLADEFEQSIHMTKKTLVIGKSRYKKYNLY